MKKNRRNMLKMGMAAMLPGIGCNSAAQPVKERHYVIIGDSWVGNPSIIEKPLLDAWGGTATSFGYPGQTASAINAQAWRSQLTALKPDVVIWTYGVNDYYKNIDPDGIDGIGQGIENTAELIQTAYPGVLMLFLLPAQTEGNGNPLFSWSSYQRAAAASAAPIPKLTYFDMGERIAPYSAGNPDWRNGSHISRLGYQKLFASPILESDSRGSPRNVSGIPMAPENLRSVVYSETAVEIFWNRARASDRVVNYEIRRNGAVLTTLDATSFYEGSLAAGANYLYEVSAVDIFGNQSALSKVSVNTRDTITNRQTSLEPISGLRSTVYSSTAVELFWNRSRVGELRYDVYRNGAKIGSSTGTSFFDSQFNRRTGAIYKLIATDPGSGFTSPAATVSITAAIQ